jgi:aryl-phospho-beta-D-glucosidase BglC (GH1 family)
MLAPAALILQQHAALAVRGRHLFYGGQEVRLRGVAVGDVLLAREGRDDEADYREISEGWGANAVRIGIAPPTWRRRREEAIAALRANVAAALKSRMFVVIDWHAISWPDGYAQKGWEGLPDAYDGDFALALDFWRWAAQEWKGDGRIIFQLWCEPLHGPDDYDRPPGSLWPKLEPFMDRLIEAIRAEGAENVVLLTGPRWAYDLTGLGGALSGRRNVALHWHVYGGHSGNRIVEMLQMLDNADHQRPVIVSEWGWERETNGHYQATEEEFGAPFSDLILEARGLHWLAWCWHPTWSPRLIESDWRTPTEYGRAIQRRLRRLNRDAVRP